MIVPVLLFALGLVCLIKGGDWFVDGASGVARRFHIPELLIGATIVSIGTTLPEVMVSTTSAVLGHGEIAYGNAIGSIICNTSLIAALTIAIRPGKVDAKSLKMPILFFFAAAIIYCLVAYCIGYFSRWVGIVMLALFVAYIVLSTLQMKKGPAQQEEKSEEVPAPLWKELLLPELVTAITSLVKGHSGLSLGNVVGANLFNLVLVSGISVTVSPFAVPTSATIAGKNASLVLEIPLMLFVMLFMTIPALTKKRLYRFQGIALLAIYAAFCIFQFTL